VETMLDLARRSGGSVSKIILSSNTASPNVLPSPVKDTKRVVIPDNNGYSAASNTGRKANSKIPTIQIIKSIKKKTWERTFAASSILEVNVSITRMRTSNGKKREKNTCDRRTRCRNLRLINDFENLLDENI